MKITSKELKKIERLLESPDQANVDLGIAILSGFAIDADGAKWLFDYYKKLYLAENQKSYRNLQRFLTGTMNTKPTKASRVLMLIFEKTTDSVLSEILTTFMKDKTLTFPQLDLEDFPQILFSMPPIEKLNWQYGQLNHLSNKILDLPYLKTLDLRHQPLMTIDENIVKHPTLEELWIGNALIVTEDLADMSNFEILIEAAY